MLIVATRNGQAIRFNEEDARPMGRNGHGVRALRLAEGEDVYKRQELHHAGPWPLSLLTVYGEMEAVPPQMEEQPVALELSLIHICSRRRCSGRQSRCQARLRPPAKRYGSAAGWPASTEIGRAHA